MKYTKLNKKVRGKRFYKLSSLLAKAVNLSEDLEINSSEEKEIISLLDATILSHKKDNIKKEIESIPTSILDVEQGTEDWLRVRDSFLLTGSNTPFTMKGTLIPTWKEFLAERLERYLLSTSNDELFKAEIERTSKKTYKTDMMQRGNELEAEALDAYEKMTDNFISRGVVMKKGDILVSLDGVEHDIGNIVLEAKCPSHRNFILQIKEDILTKRYYTQTQTQMYVLGAKEAKLITYFPNRKLHVRTVYRNDEFVINMFESLKVLEAYFKELLEIDKEYQI
jgi:hypothetical protein